MKKNYLYSFQGIPDIFGELHLPVISEYFTEGNMRDWRQPLMEVAEWDIPYAQEIALCVKVFRTTHTGRHDVGRFILSSVPIASISGEIPELQETDPWYKEIKCWTSGVFKFPDSEMAYNESKDFPEDNIDPILDLTPGTYSYELFTAYVNRNPDGFGRIFGLTIRNVGRSGVFDVLIDPPKVQTTEPPTESNSDECNECGDFDIQRFMAKTYLDPKVIDIHNMSDTIAKQYQLKEEDGYRYLIVKEECTIVIPYRVYFNTGWYTYIIKNTTFPVRIIVENEVTEILCVSDEVEILEKGGMVCVSYIGTQLWHVTGGVA